MLYKGNAIIRQFGGPTSVIDSSLCGLIQEGLKSKKIERILDMRYGIQVVFFPAKKIMYEARKKGYTVGL